MQDRSIKNAPAASSEIPGVKRRGMLFGLGAAGALAAVAAAATVARPQQAIAAGEQPQPAKPAPEKGGGYHLSQHVLRYYETTKV